MIHAAEELGQLVGIAAACDALGVPHSTLDRARREPATAMPSVERSPSERALSVQENATVRSLLNSPRVQDSSPRQVDAPLFDEGRDRCSWRTMSRILAEHDEVRERRDQLRRPSDTKPELLATAPKQLWRWGMTKLKGPTTWTYDSLYVVLDVFSRSVVGWLIAEGESAALAGELIEATCRKEGIEPEQLTVHADRGSSMTSKLVAQLLADLGVTKSHSRPYVSNDNPFSEAQFKTLKYRPTFPDRCGSLEDARAWARPFFHWYNHQHHHTSLGLMTPAAVHLGQAAQLSADRHQVLLAAYQRHPERFGRGQPTPPALQTAVWINPPLTPNLPALVPLALDLAQPIFPNFLTEVSQAA